MPWQEQVDWSDYSPELYPEQELESWRDERTQEIEDLSKKLEKWKQNVVPAAIDRIVRDQQEKHQTMLQKIEDAEGRPVTLTALTEQSRSS